MSTLDGFRSKVLGEGRRLYRDLPWRQTRDPYAVWVSEVMLQQTQVARVMEYWPRWMERFPSPDALAEANAADVLSAWQGLGYNRRALALKNAASALACKGGSVPTALEELVKLPGIGVATAAGIRAFAFNLPGVYLETNVRAVFLHELFPDAEGVPDSALRPLVAETCPNNAQNKNDDPRTWYYALLDYGAELKRTLPNPSRRSRSHVKQSRFEGSRRQKRAKLVRLLLGAPEEGLTTEVLAAMLTDSEQNAKRKPVTEQLVHELLEELAHEGFCSLINNYWHIQR